MFIESHATTANTVEGLIESRFDKGNQTRMGVGSLKKRTVTDSVTLEGILSFTLKKLYTEKIEEGVFCIALTSIT